MSRIRRLFQFFTGGATSATGRIVYLAAADRSVVALPGVDRSTVAVRASAQG